MSNTIKLKRGSGSDPSASDLVVGELALRTDNGKIFTKKDNGSVAEISGGGGIDDGDKGDITVSNGGDTFTIDNGVVSTAKIADDAVTAAKIADGTITSTQIAAGTIGEGRIADSAITSAKIANGAIGNVDISSAANIDGSKINPSFTSDLTITSASPEIQFTDSTENSDYRIQVDGGQFKIEDSTNAATRVTLHSNGNFDVAQNIGVGGTVDGRDIATDGTKLDGIESNATADQTAAEIKTLLNSNGIVNAQIDASAAIAGTKISPDFGSQDITTTGNITAGGGFLGINGTGPQLRLNDTNSENDFEIQNADGIFKIRDIDASADRLTIASSGQATISGNLDCSSGVDVTGNITVTGTVDGVDIAARNTLFGGLTSSSGVLTNGVTATTQSAGDNSTKVATTAYTDTAISNLVDSSPSTLNTLNELAAALGDDANFSTTVTNSIATKMPLAGGQFTGNITFSGSQTVDGRDLSVDGAKLDTLSADTIENGTSFVSVSNNSNITISRAGSTRLTATGAGVEVTGNISVSGTVDGRDLATDGSKLDGIESGATADQTASEILTLIKTVDGSGSGLDADTLDGISSASFLRSDANDTFSGILTLSSSSRDTLNFSANSTDDNRGLAFNGRIAVSADYNDGWLRLNNASEFGNGIYTPSTIRADGGFNVAGNTIINGSGQVVVNASSATQLATARTIAGTSFDGSANIDISYANLTNKLSVGDGGLTQNNFTNTLKSKLDGIASGATNVTNTNQLTNGAGFITATLTNEEVQDIVGGMVSSNTESGITVTYQDSDGTLDFSVASQTDNNFTNADHSKLDGIEAGATADQSASEILTLIKTVDGSGSGLDADSVDGIAGSSFLRSDAADTASENITINDLKVGAWSGGSAYKGIFHSSQSSGEYLIMSNDTHTFISATSGSNVYIRNGGNDSTNQLIVGSGNDALTWRGSKVFHAGNDGAGSGLDADSVDGIAGSSLLRSDTADTASGDITFSGGGGAATIAAGSDIRFTNGDWTGNTCKIQHHSNFLYVVGGANGIIFRENDTNRWVIDDSGHLDPADDSTYDIGSNGVRVRNGYFDTLYGDGSNLTGISAGATGGGSDEVFYENDQTVTSNYTITNGKNAMAAGPITINSGVVVTVGSGETLTIV